MMDQEGRGQGWEPESDGAGQVGDQVSPGVRTCESEAEGDWVSVSATVGLRECWGDARFRGWGRKGGGFLCVDTLPMEVLKYIPCILILTELLGKFY